MRPRARGVLGALAAAALAACGGDEPQLSAILITLDTTNRDALGCFGQSLALTPNLDRLAREGIAFDEARTVAPLTLPAHASMLTGLVPLRHGVRDNGLLPLPGSAETLAERLSAEGFDCAAFVSAVVLAEPYGLGQGFATYDAPRGSQVGGGTAHWLERPASETVGAAREWLRARDRSRPFFLWVHAFEPHEPYAPPEAALARAGGDAYLGEVAALDDALGGLLAALEEEHGLERGLENVVVLVSADHGEALGEHGERTHSVLCVERVLRVPMLLRLPGGERVGERDARAASVADIAPTLLDALGFEPPRGIDGRSLLAPPAERGVYFESYTGWLNYGWAPLAGWLEGGAKYVHGTQAELYDVAHDPGELANLAAERPGDVERARAAIRALAGLPRLASAESGLDEALAADVQALGYAGAAAAGGELPEPLDETGLPAPRTRMAELELFYRALVRHSKGKKDEAIADLEQVVAENPRNATALNVLASYLYERKETARALEVLQRIPEHARERSTVQDLMGHCLEGLGRRAEALACFERALALKPGDPHQAKDVERARAAER